MCEQELLQPFGERNLPRFAFRRFRARDAEDLLGEVDVLPTFWLVISPRRMPVSSAMRIMACRWSFAAPRSILLLGDAQDLPPGAPLASHLQAGERICGEQLLVDGPIQDVPQDAQVPVDGRVLDRRVYPPPLIPEVVPQVPS